MKNLNRELGKRGEEIAAKFLREKEYKIIESNYQTRFGEIDLIAEKDKILHFIEVKLKQGENFGTPEEMIGPDKLTRVQHMAEYYLLEKPEMAAQFSQQQIDAVCIVVGKDQATERINLYENLGF